MSKSRAAILIVPAMFTLAGAFETREPYTDLSPRVEQADQPVLSVKEDRARGRRWELAWGSATAYDMATGDLVRSVSLDGANLSGARGTCLPDMLLGRSGAVIVSSNAQPSLWRISPARFEVERFDVEVDADHDKDFGFSGLAWSADERSLHAVGTPTGTLWRIDLASGKATKVDQTAGTLVACRDGSFSSPSSRWPAVPPGVPG